MNAHRIKSVVANAVLEGTSFSYSDADRSPRILLAPESCIACDYNKMSSSREFNGQGILPLCSMRIRNFFGGNTNKVSCTLSTVITVLSLKEIRHEHTPFDTLLSGDFRIYVSRNLYHNIFNFQCPNSERVTRLKAIHYMQCIPLCPGNTGVGEPNVEN